MKIFVATVLFAIAAIPLGFVALATIEAISMSGIEEAALTIFGHWLNLIVALTCVVAGMLCALAGAYLLRSATAASSTVDLGRNAVD